MYALGDAELFEAFSKDIKGGDSDFGLGNMWVNWTGTNRFRQHPRGYNMLFADGHVAEIHYDALFSTNAANQARWYIEHTPRL